MSSCECISASCSTEHVRRARKAYSCDECGSAIARGESHLYMTGIWDGTPGSFRLHIACDELRSEYERRVREGQQAEREALERAERQYRIDRIPGPYAAAHLGRRFDGLCDCIAIGGLREALEEFTREVLGYDPKTGGPPRDRSAA